MMRGSVSPVQILRDALANNAGLPGMPLVLTNEIGMKLSGLSVSTGAGEGNTWVLKSVAPGDYDAIQLFIEHSETSATTTYRAIVASTETTSLATDSTIYHPVVGATEYNALDAVESYGWKTVTFAGATSILATAATAAAPSEIASDWIPLSSVPRADGGTYPAYMIRLSVLGGTSSFGGSTANMNLATAANGGFIVQSYFATDATGLFVTAPGANSPYGEQSNGCPTIGVRLRMRKDGISLYGVGDSLTQNGLVADGMSAFGLRVAAAISALGLPCGWVNGGFASRDMTVLTAANVSRIAAWKPNAVVIQGFSPNGPGANYTTDAKMRYGVQQAAASVQSIVSASRAVGAKMFISTAVPSSSAVIPNASQDALRVAYNSTIMATKNRDITPVDFSALVATAAAPARISATYDYGDAVHINELGIALQAATLLPKIKTAFGVN